MKIIHVLDEYTSSAGGLPAAVAKIAQHTASCGIDVEIICTRHDSLPMLCGVSLEVVKPSSIGIAWGWSFRLASVLRKAIATGQQRIVHLHGVWKAPQWIAARIAKQFGVPVVITDHGTLDPWLWDYKGQLQRWKKEIYWNWIAYPIFRHASVIHAITSRGSKCLTELFPRQRIEEIPNAVDLDEISNMLEKTGESDISREQIILFVGRLDPQKGIDILIKAFARAALSLNWKLVIVGPNRVNGYFDLLKRLVIDEKISDRVSFLGQVYGIEKWKLYRKVWVLAAPSHFESISLVNLEAAACQTSSITTFETGLFDWEQGGGLLISPNVEMLIAALRRACSWSDQERKERGKTSLELVRRRYSWDVIVKQWLTLYQSLII